MIGKVRQFIAEVVVELRKVTWSTKQELMDATWLILASSLILGVFIGFIDFVLSKILRMLIK